MRIAVLIVILAFPAHAFCGGAYTVTLANGNTLSANSYKITGGKIHLEFPLGEAAFNMTEVASIKDQGGQDMLFQEKGTYLPPVTEDAAGNASAANYGEGLGGAASRGSVFGVPTQARADNDAGPVLSGAPVQRKWAAAYYSPQVDEINSFVDEMFKADEEGRDIPEEDIEKAFSAFFDDGAGNAAEGSGGW